MARHSGAAPSPACSCNMPVGFTEPSAPIGMLRGFAALLWQRHPVTQSEQQLQIFQTLLSQGDLHQLVTLPLVQTLQPSADPQAAGAALVPCYQGKIRMSAQDAETAAEHKAGLLQVKGIFTQRSSASLSQNQCN